MRQFASRINIAIALFDPCGRLIYLNPAAEETFGVEFARLEGHSLEQLLAMAQPTDVNGTRLDAQTAPVGHTLAGGGYEMRTVSVRDARGRERRLETLTIPVQGQGGNVFGVMSIIWEQADAEPTEHSADEATAGE